MKSIEITASSYDKAVKEALASLDLAIEDVDIEVVKTSGLIIKKVTIIATEKQNANQKVLAFVDGVISNMGLDIQTNIKEDEKTITIGLSGNDTSKLIGYRGDVLDSLQYLALLVYNRNNSDNKRLVIDGENYREKRSITLAKLAKRLAFQCAKSNEDIALEPMNPFERRIIHATLADDTYVITTSEGEEPNRHVVIKPNPNRPRKRRDGETNSTYNKDRKPRENREYKERKPRENRPVNNTATSQDATPATTTTQISKDFRRKGAGKMKSYGAPKSKYF